MSLIIALQYMPTEIPTLAPTSETFVPTMTPVSVVEFVDDVEI